MSDPGGPYDFVYVHSDIPEGMTIRDWRRQRAAEQAVERERAPAARRRRVLAAAAAPALGLRERLRSAGNRAAKMLRAVRIPDGRGYPRSRIRSFRRTAG
jgi:hypothetical protein